MCTPKTIKKIDSGQALVISKLKLSLTALVLFAGIIVMFTTTRLQAADNKVEICDLKLQNKLYEQKLDATQVQVNELHYNVKRIFTESGIEWISLNGGSPTGGKND